MESSTPYKGGEIDSRQAEAIDTLSSANEYQGQSRIQTLRKLPWNRKWKYFRDQLLARTVVIAAIVCVVVYIAVQILAPAPGPKLYVAVFDDAVGQQGAASLQSQVAKRLDLPEGRKGGVLVDTYFSNDENGISKLQTMIANHEIDAIVATPKTFKQLSGYGYLTNRFVADQAAAHVAFRRFRHDEGLQGFRRSRFRRRRQRQGRAVRSFDDRLPAVEPAEISQVQRTHRHRAGIAESHNRATAHRLSQRIAVPATACTAPQKPPTEETMASIFSQDNPFNDFMSTVGDMAMISIAWTICSIPVVTVGASTAAACEVARELQSGSCKGIFRSFWAAFKRRFPTTLALTAVIAAFCGLALFDLWYLSRQSTDTVAVLYGVTIVVIAVVGSALAFVLPLTGRSKLSVGEQLTQSARLALGKPHIAFAALLLNIWPIIVVLIAPEQTLMLVPLLWIFVGAGASFWVQMNLIRKTFSLD